MSDMKKPGSVDDYIAAQPPPAQKLLSELRQIIKQEAPQAEEKLSYGMPYYRLGKRLFYLGSFKNHVSLFAMPSAIKKFHKELESYGTTKAAIHFPLGKPMDKALVRKIVKFRVKENLIKV